MRCSPGLSTIFFFVCLSFAAQAPAHADAQKARAAFRRAVALEKQGKTSEALAQFQASYDQNGDAATLYRIGVCNKDLGADEEAVRVLHLYVDAAPGGANVEKARALIAELEAKIAANRPPPPPVVVAAPPPLPAEEDAVPVQPPPPAAKPPVNPEGKYGLGARIRGVFVPGWALGPYTDQHTSMQNLSFALEFTYHRGTKFDVVTSLDFSFMSPSDGNYLGKNHKPSLDTHYLQFQNLNFISIDVALIGHHAFNDWLEIIYGGGLGIGVVLGQILETNDSSSCNSQNAGNTQLCYPVTVGPINPNSPATNAALAATNNGQADTADHPHQHAVYKPPVMAVVNLLIGLRFKVQKHVRIKAEIGFRDAIFGGVGGEYVF